MALLVLSLLPGFLPESVWLHPVFLQARNGDSELEQFADDIAQLRITSQNDQDLVRIRNLQVNVFLICLPVGESRGFSAVVAVVLEDCGPSSREECPVG